jgi:hypothetical protein
MYLPEAETSLSARDLAGSEDGNAEKENNHDVVPYMMIGTVVVVVVVLYNLFVATP